MKCFYMTSCLIGQKRTTCDTQTMGWGGGGIQMVIESPGNLMESIIVGDLRETGSRMWS
jgi:hypothetical protein